MSAPGKATGSTGRPLPPLLPSEPQLQLPPRSTKPISRPKAVLAACASCRKHKVKCSGDRPKCRRCATQHLDCHYSTKTGETTTQALKRNLGDLQKQTNADGELLDLIKSLPDHDVLDVVKRLRAGTKAQDILNHLKAGDAMLQMAVAPETRLRYEFPYRTEFPSSYFPKNPYLDSVIYEATSLWPGKQPPDRETSGVTGNARSQDSKGPYVTPFHAADLHEPLLVDIKLSPWTSVCDDDKLMRDLLRYFFRCEYHFTSAFHKDYFLEDLAAQRQDFCSSLLVNVVLAYACICYPHFPNRSEYWNPTTLTYRFLAEAKRIWELEGNYARLTTIQTGILFSVFHNLSGLDEIGQPYRIQAVALAHKMRLFDTRVEVATTRLRNGRAYTAWALYCWESLSAFSFMIPPLLTKPPDWPLPDPSQKPEWYSETWLRYPLREGLHSSCFGDMFKARCDFRIIMNEFCFLSHTKDSEVTLQRADELHSALKAWYTDLPGPLQPNFIVLPGQLQLHMYYHHLIISIYEPLLDKHPEVRPTLRQIIFDARRFLQTLVRLYYLRHGFEAMDLFIVIPLMLTCCDCIDALGEDRPSRELEDLRSTLILVAQGLYTQRRNHYLASALFRVIHGRMQAPEIALLKNTMSRSDLEEYESETQKDMIQQVRSHWPVSVVKKKEDIDANVLGNLVESYGQLRVEGGSEERPGRKPSS